MKLELPKKQLQIYFALLLSLGVPFAWTLGTVKVPMVSPDFSTNPSPFGYTISMVIFLVPILVFSLWLSSNRKYRIESKAFVGTVIMIFLLGSFLDFVFGYSFFYFPNKGSVTGFRLPSYSFGDGHWVADYLPIEEFGFYFFGGTYMVSSYLWGVLFWFKRYNHTDHKAVAQNFPKLLSVNYTVIIGAFLLIIGGILFKKNGPYPEGFPGYFTFLVLMALLPCMILYNVTKYLVNWRSFTFMSFLLLMVSLVYEATLGMPYGWWRYHPDQMLGIFITGWSNLPIEAVLLWIAAGFGTVFLFEGLRTFFYMDRSIRKALWGGPGTGSIVGSTATTKLPPYVDQGNFMPVPQGPYVNTKALMAQFLVKVDPKKIEAVIDTYLNKNLKGSVQYLPFLSVILMTYAKLTGYVSDDQGKNMGQLPEDDLVFWIPVLAVKKFLGIPIPSHIAMFPYRLYVNSPYGLCSGREVYGFRKTAGTFIGPEDYKNPEMQLNVLGFKTYDPNQSGQDFPLLKLTLASSKCETNDASFSCHEDHQRALFKGLIAEKNQNILPDILEDFIKFIVDWFHPETTSVSLKQFRDVVDPSRSCLQQIIEAKTEVTAFYSGGFIPGTYRLEINHLVSEPLAEHLGILLDEKGGQDLSQGFWVNSAFIMKNGVIIQ